MTERRPTSVVWSDHALVRAQLLGFSRSEVEDAVLDSHPQRAQNAGAGDWQVRVGRLVVVYNYPADDELTALVVTLWRS